MPVPPALALRNRLSGHKVIMEILNGHNVHDDARVCISAETATLILKMLPREALPHRVNHVAKAPSVSRVSKVPQVTKVSRVTKGDPKLQRALDIADELGFPWYKKMLKERFHAGDTLLVDRLVAQKDKCKKGVGKIDWKARKVFCSK